MANLDDAPDDLGTLGETPAPDLDTPVTAIIDNGSGYMKAGTSVDDHPTAIFPTLVGRPRRRFLDLYAKDGPEGIPQEGTVFVGEEAIANRHHLSFTYPIDHGHIDNWIDMEEVWNKTYSLLNLEASEHPVLVTEPPLCSLRHREKMAEMFFEVYNVPELNISVTGLMAIYGTGRTTGFVLDIGEGITQCVPVFDGYLEKASVKRSDFGGQELQMYLQKILCDMGYPMTTRDDYEHVRVIKETLCFCSSNPAEDQLREDLEKTYHLPDGLTLRDGCTTEITLGPERFYPPEALFNPQLCGRDNPSLIDLVWSSIMACPIENRKSLIGSVVLSGSSSLFPGFPERLEQELKNTAPPQARPHVHVLSHPSRGTLVWQGARLYCQPSIRPMQDHLWVSRQEWDEVGKKIVARKTMTSLRTSASASGPAGLEENWIAALSLTRRMPPRLLDRTISGLVQLCPSLRVELLARIDQKLKIRFDPVEKKYFIACIYNKQGDSYRSPWTNDYVSPPSPPRAAAATNGLSSTTATSTATCSDKRSRPFKPSDHLRRLEIAYNDLFNAYRTAYYDGGVSSVYLWSLQSEDGFAGAFLIHHSVDASNFSFLDINEREGKGSWDSLHIVEVTQTTTNVHYRLASTVIVDMKQQQKIYSSSSSNSNSNSNSSSNSDDNSGSEGSSSSNSSERKESSSKKKKQKFYAGVMLTRSTEQSHKVGATENRGSNAALPHIRVIGPMIEATEAMMRTAVEKICLATVYSVIDSAFGLDLNDSINLATVSQGREKGNEEEGYLFSSSGDVVSSKIATVHPSKSSSSFISRAATAAAAAARAARIAAANKEISSPPSSLRFEHISTTATAESNIKKAGVAAAIVSTTTTTASTATAAASAASSSSTATPSIGVATLSTAPAATAATTPPTK